ncbi:hypothetical protein C8R44DRAFT_858312 [Mycena epipterygia]|nr:hypothetical protein C8R44DRAFT_858312 [Mycena epipterygia]
MASPRLLEPRPARTMDGRFPLVRARNRFRNSTATEGAKCHDLLYTSLTALRASSDAFPPLKSVVGAVTSVLEISQRVTHSKKDARQLARRTVEILEALADAIPDPAAIPDPMLASIKRFERTLEDIKTEMCLLMKRGRMWRLRHLNRSEGALLNFNRRLDDASREFTIGAAVRGEALTHQVHTQLLNVSAASHIVHNKEMLLLRGILILQVAFFCPSPVLAV